MEAKNETIVKIESKTCKNCGKTLEEHALVSMELCNSCKHGYLNEMDDLTMELGGIQWTDRSC